MKWNCYDYCKVVKLKLKRYSTNQSKIFNVKSYNLFYVYSSVILLQYYLPLGHCACINLISLYPSPPPPTNLASAEDLLFLLIPSLQLGQVGSKDGAVVRAFASHQCSPGSLLPASTPYVGWVCCWFSPLLWEVFLWVLQFSPFLKN